MSRANTQYARERDDAHPNAPQPPVISDGIALLVDQIGPALRDAQAAFAELIQAEAQEDRQAAHAAAIKLAAALGCDPKALAKKVAEGLKQ